MTLIAAVRDYIVKMLNDVVGIKVLVVDEHTVSMLPGVGTNRELLFSIFNISVIFIVVFVSAQYRQPGPESV